MWTGQPRIYASDQFSYAINAKELHQFLFPLEHTHKTFSKWIISHIAHYGFEEGYDFLPDYDQSENQGLQDVCLSLDMAKELARNTRTEQGREARYYLIEFEKQLRKQTFPIELFDKKVRQLNTLAQSMKIGHDVVIVPIVDVVDLIQTVRKYQLVGHFYAPPEYAISVSRVNAIIERIKRDAGKPFQDEGE